MTDKRTIEVFPAVLPQSLKELEEALRPLRGVVRHAQVDVVDGHYARGRTWPYRDSATFEKIVQDEHGLPFWDTIDFQFDLMIHNPQMVVKKCIAAGASQVVVHAKSEGAVEAVQAVVDVHTEEIGISPVRVGVALGALEQPEALEPFEAQFDFVQVMGVDREGRQGEPFDIKALYLIERLRARYPELPIQVDGGVTLENARTLARAGANRLIVGHAIIKADDPAAMYKQFVDIANA